MTMHDFDFDPDDNFANGLPVGREELDDDATVEALVWQLLLLVNPGDEDAALQQFTAYQDAVSADGDGIEPISRIRDAIDWKAGFHVADDDPATAIDAIAELASRWNLRIDWGVEDPTDDDFLAATDVATLIGVAFDRLREYGYTLWTWDTGTDATAGWMTLATDDEAMRMVAGGLGIDVRIGAA